MMYVILKFLLCSKKKKKKENTTTTTKLTIVNYLVIVTVFMKLKLDTTQNRTKQQQKVVL